jgi:hypothetical protein
MILSNNKIRNETFVNNQVNDNAQPFLGNSVNQTIISR